MRVVISEPGKPARVANIKNDLAEYQKTVGGLIEALFYPYGCALVCNEEGKIRKLPANRWVVTPGGIDLIFGTFFFCGVKDDEFTDIPADMEELLLRFYGQRGGEPDND